MSSCRSKQVEATALSKSNSNRLMLKSLALVVPVLLFQGLAFPQDPSQLVQRMVRNELAAAKDDQSEWIYRDSNSQKGMTRVEEVIQTPEGHMSRLISVNGKAPKPTEEKRSQDDIQK